MPGFPVRGTKERPRAAFIEESRMKFINANKWSFHADSEVGTPQGLSAAG
jgi:hypothetical protein